MARSPYPWSPPGGEVRDLDLRVRVLEGRESPTIVLLHGLVGSNRYFGACFDRLSDVARVVVPDLLGFGGSPRPQTSAYDARAHAQAVRQTLAALTTTGPIFLVGHSAGALVALELAAIWPEAIRGVVAFGAPIYHNPDDARERVGGLGAHVRFLAMDGKLARWMCAAMCRHRTLAAHLVRLLRRDLPAQIASDVTLHSWTSYSRTLRNLILHSSVRQELVGLALPVLLVVGAEDSVVDASLLGELAARSSSIELETWPGGHDLPLSHPARSVERIRSFLAENSAG